LRREDVRNADEGIVKGENVEKGEKMWGVWMKE
jgi:hypothetical protein